MKNMGTGDWKAWVQIHVVWAQGSCPPLENRNNHRYLISLSGLNGIMFHTALSTVSSPSKPLIKVTLSLLTINLGFRLQVWACPYSREKPSLKVGRGLAIAKCFAWGMKHWREEEIHRAKEHKRDLAQSAFGGLFLRGALGWLREAEDSNLTDKLTCPRKLVETTVGIWAASSPSHESQRDRWTVSRGAKSLQLPPRCFLAPVACIIGFKMKLIWNQVS